MAVPTNSKEAAFTSRDKLVLGQKVRRCVVRVAVAIEKEDNECSRRDSEAQYKYTPLYDRVCYRVGHERMSAAVCISGGFRRASLAIAIVPESRRSLALTVGFITESNSPSPLQVVARTVVSFHGFVSNHDVFWTPHPICLVCSYYHAGARADILYIALLRSVSF